MGYGRLDNMVRKARITNRLKGMMILGIIGLLLENPLAVAGSVMSRSQPMTGMPSHSFGAFMQGIGSPLPSIGIRQPIIRGIILVPNSLFLGIPYTSMLVVPPFGFQTIQLAKDSPEPGPVPVRSAPPIFFIQQCGKYVRVQIPESGSLETVEHGVNC
jgi:hypothetical protein